MTNTATEAHVFRDDGSVEQYDKVVWGDGVAHCFRPKDPDVEADAEIVKVSIPAARIDEVVVVEQESPPEKCPKCDGLIDSGGFCWGCGELIVDE